MGMFVRSSMCNGSCIECFLMAFWSSGDLSGRWEFLGSSFTPYSMTIITCNDDLRNAKGHPMLGVASEIPFLSHLMRCDGVACVLATCFLLIGWTWCASRWDLSFSHDFSVFRTIFLRTLASLLSSLLFLFLFHFFCKFSSFELESLSFLSQVWFFLFLLKFYSFSCVNGWLF